MEAELVAIANATTVNRANTAIGVIKTAAAAKGRTVLRKSERIVNDAVLAISKNATTEPISFKYVLPDVPFKKQKAEFTL